MKKLKTNRVWIISIALLFLSSVVSSSEKKWTLTQLLEEPQTLGVDFEPDELKQTALKDILSSLHKQREYIKNNCLTEDTNTPKPILCSLFHRSNNRKLARIKRMNLKKSARAVIKEIKAAQIQNLAPYTEMEILRGLKKIQDIGKIKSMFNKAVSASECLTPESLVAFGLRSEMNFPDPEMKSLATKLYTRASTCGEGTASMEARYRLGLLHIWDGKCDDAESVLSKISNDDSVIDYRMRATYWRLYCADQKKNTDLKSELQNGLKRDYPLSLHFLLAHPGTTTKLSTNQFSPSSPELTFRSKEDSLNLVVRYAELLSRLGKRHFASRLLELNQSKLEKQDPGFQLYWSVLSSRVGNIPMSFQVAARVIRENPDLISKPLLEFMYPLERYELIQNVKPQLDPFLVISVIRQESAFDVLAKSPAGALGLMQLEWTTARLFERVSKRQLYDPKVNIRVGVKYFSTLLKRFNGDLELALAAYNAGPSRIHQWVKRYPITDNPLLFIDLLPTRETRIYVSSILRNYYWYTQLYPQILSAANFHVKGRSPLIQSILIDPSKVSPSPSSDSSVDK